MTHLRRVLPGIAVVVAILPQAVLAAAPDVITRYGCTGCHGIDTKIVGPAYKDVGAKYKGKAGAKEELAKSIRGGSVGKWGQIPMPPQAALSDAEVSTVTDWLTAGAP